jgi:hypothetical protein
MSNETPVLRYEANSISTNLLSDSQKQAFEQIVRSLAEAVSDLKNRTDAEKQGTSHAIDSDRKSRTVMISGDRGTGKTTLMLTLQNSILNLDPEKNKLENVRESCKTELNSIRGRVVWLEPLDMEHSSNTTNLFVSILARIDEAIKNCFKPTKCEKDYDYPSYGMNVTPIPGRDDILMELRRLQVDASIAWEGNLVARAPHLDSDAYATEVMRAERARMGLNRRFRELLDGIATQIPWGEGVKDPIFVLAVDDFDLNPARCLDILKLIRSLNVPRLFTLVLGDEEVAEEVFRLDIQGDMSRIANVTIDDRDGISSAFIKRIKHISPQAVRKLVPPHQRLKLRHNTIEESLELTPRHAGQKIEDVLKQFTLYAELPRGIPKSNEGKNPLKYSLYDFMIESVPEFMLDESKEREDKNSATRRRYRYKGGRILETSIREVIDMFFSLQMMGQESKLKTSGKAKQNTDPKIQLDLKFKLISQLRTSMRKALYDDLLLDLESIEQFIYEFEGDLDEEVFRTYNLDLKLPLPESHRLQTRKFGEGNVLDRFASLSARFVEEFKLVYAKGVYSSSMRKDCNCESQKSDNIALNVSESRCSADIGSSIPNNLSSKTQAHLTLLHDLVATNPLGPIVGNYLVKPIGEYSIVTCDWNINGLKLCVPWRGAIFRTIRELEIFANSWDIFIEKTREIYGFDRYPPVGMLCNAWFYINLKVLLGDFSRPKKDELFIFFDEKPDRVLEQVTSLVLHVLNLEGQKKSYGSTRAKWTLEGLFANLFVGSGFSKTFCKAILEIEKAKDFYKSNIKRIQEIQQGCLYGMSSEFDLYKRLFFSPDSMPDNINTVLSSIQGKHRGMGRPGGQAQEDYKDVASSIVSLKKDIESLKKDTENHKQHVVGSEGYLRDISSVLRYLDTPSASQYLSGLLDLNTRNWQEFSMEVGGINKLRAALRFVESHADLINYSIDYNKVFAK